MAKAGKTKQPGGEVDYDAVVAAMLDRYEPGDMSGPLPFMELLKIGIEAAKNTDGVRLLDALIAGDIAAARETLEAWTVRDEKIRQLSRALLSNPVVLMGSVNALKHKLLQHGQQQPSAH